MFLSVYLSPEFASFRPALYDCKPSIVSVVSLALVNDSGVSSVLIPTVVFIARPRVTWCCRTSSSGEPERAPGILHPLPSFRGAESVPATEQISNK